MREQIFFKIEYDSEILDNEVTFLAVEYRVANRTRVLLIIESTGKGSQLL